MATKEKTGGRFSSLKNFLYTYKQAVILAWDTRKDVFLISTAINSLSGLLVYPQLWIGKQIVDTIIQALKIGSIESSIKKIILLLSLELVISLIRNIINRFDWVFSQTLARYLQVEIEKRTARKLNLIPISLAESPAIRDLYRKVTETVGRSTWTLIMPISALPYSLFAILSAAISLGTGSPWLIPIALLLAIPEIWVGTKNNKEAYTFDTKVSKLHRIAGSYMRYAERGKYLYENKVLGHIDKLLDSFWEIVAEIFNPRFEMWLRFAKRRFLSSIPLGVAQAAIKGYMYVLAILGKITLGTAQMQVGAVDYLINNFSGLGKQINEVFENYLYVRDYYEFMNLPDENYGEGDVLKTPFIEGIEFRDVWFKYPQNKQWTLKGVSFKVDPTDNLAIVGENGAGKTTIIKLLCRFYDPQKGEILVNGKNINDYAIDDYRQKFSALFQEFSEYPFSARVNIGFGDYKRMHQEEEIQKTARLTGIDEFVEKLPKKYDNPLDNEFEGGIEPSKGQWQRLALARALFRKSEVFILDEPTSNVDPEAEEAIFDKLLGIAKEKIVFLVSHRFSTVRRADKILVLSKGVIEEMGSHEELMRQNGLYAKLFSLQAKAYKEN